MTSREKEDFRRQLEVEDEAGRDWRGFVQMTLLGKKILMR